MSFYQELAELTASERHYLQASPIIQDALRGTVSVPQYVAFLREAYFHVRETVPLLMACGSRLRHDQEWLRAAVAHYIEDEIGHDEWILSDIAHCGADSELVRNGRPSFETEMMVAYAWDTIQRGNPAGFFGMVYVLEGTSVTLATQAADAIRNSLELPKKAFTYLVSHGSIDQTHVQFLEELLDRFDDPADRAAIEHAARRFFRLYASIFRALPGAAEAAERPELRSVA